MKDIDQLELFKAAVALAVADAELRRSEMGVLKGLAARIGIGEASFEAMLEAARRDDAFADQVMFRSEQDSRMALELLVAQARIDGEISPEERGLLVRIAAKLNLTGDEFQSVYRAGIDRADRIRQARENAR